MSSEWPLVSLPDVCEFQEGPGILAKDFRDDGVPLIRLKGVESPTVTLTGCNYLDPDMVQKKWNHFRLHPGDLLISTSATLGRVSEVAADAEGAVAYTGLIRFRPLSDSLDRSFLKVFLGSKEFLLQAEASASGSVIRHFGPSHLRKMQMTLPPISIQESIGSFADSINDRINNLRATNATLEAIAQAIFKSWFIDFDPVRAKMEGREPEGMDAETAALFPSEFEESELGLIPRGWRDGQLSDLVELKYGKALKASDRRPGEIPVYGSGGITGSHNEALVQQPTVIVGRKGSVGTLFWEDRPSFPIDTAFFVSPKVVPLTFCYYTMIGLGLNQMNTDAAVPGLNRANAYRQPVIIPPSDVLHAWDAISSTLRRRMRLLSNQMEALALIRDSVLPRLISGKLQIEEAQNAAEVFA